MKKLLFTLCAVLAGVTAFAQNAVTLQVVDNEGNPLKNNELIVEPGSTTTVHWEITAFDATTVADGFQTQYIVKAQDGTVLLKDGIVKITNQGNALAPKYFVPEGMSTLPSNAMKSTFNTVDNAYRIIATNGDYGFVWGTAATIAAVYGVSEAEVAGMFDAEAIAIGNVFSFNIEVGADWDDEYATVDFDEEYNKIQWRSTAASKFTGNLDFKIINKNKLPKDLTGEISVSEPDEEGYVTVSYTGDEDVTITVEGYEVVDGKIKLPDYGTYTLNVTVSADGYNNLTGEYPVTWTAPAVAPDKPGISIVESDDFLTMTVTVTAAEGCTLIVNNEAVNSNTYTYTVNRTTDIYTADADVAVTAKAVKDNLESEVATDSESWTVVIPTVATPVITFNETKDGEVVTAVAVDIVNYTEYAITVNGEPYTAKTEVATFTANYTEDQVIKVTAKNDPIEGHSEFAKTAEDTYTLKKLEKKDVDAPDVTPTTGDDAVTLSITWPESDGDQVIMVNGQESTQTSFPRQDEDYTVALDIYVTEGATCNESDHYTQTINVPKKVTTPTDQTGAPTFIGPYTKPDVNAAFVQIENANTEPDAVIYYQVIDPNGNIVGATEENPEGWQVYDVEIACYGTNGGGQDGHYEINAYAQAPGKDPSLPIHLGFNVDYKTGVEELMAGKTVANVRYFNMAGQEMQEANGMTIVVTTYTDGTTSAIKVMK